MQILRRIVADGLALGDVEAQQPIAVFNDALLPRRMRFAGKYLLGRQESIQMSELAALIGSEGFE